MYKPKKVVYQLAYLVYVFTYGFLVFAIASMYQCAKCKCCYEVSFEVILYSIDNFCEYKYTLLSQYICIV